NNNPTPPKTANSSKDTAWMNQNLIFEGQPLSAVFDGISRRLRVRIHTETQNILNEPLTIYLFKVNSAEQVLSNICRAQGLSYRKDGDTFIVSQSYYQTDGITILYIRSYTPLDDTAYSVSRCRTPSFRPGYWRGPRV